MSSRHREVVLPDAEARRLLRRKTRRDFLIGGLAAVGAIGGYEWMHAVQEENGVPKLERAALELNGKLSHAYLSDSHLMKTYARSDVRALKPNGDIGLDSSLSGWSLAVITGSNPNLKLSLDDVRALGRVEMITRFVCIEGWSSVVQWAGARFSDFTRKYFPQNRQLPRFVRMTTPNEEYYVGLDMKSMLHPQTLLAYEHNGEPLTAKHGAPLRLVIPVKYGIKNIKCIGTIQYADERPVDYWAEEGYDWFAGL
jgi:DMSO/TMAO reductase YedYZ molybdopterin-dependent catalytic subunit